MNANEDIGPMGPFDLEITRRVDVPVKYVWMAWTDPEHLKQWFAPRPYEVTEATLDLRPGGAFDFVMKAPDGTLMPNRGCVLQVIDRKRLVFTDTLQAGWRPAPEPFFTAIVTFEEAEGGTLYRARAVHGNEETRNRHAEMGFEQGWGTVAGQMAEYAAGLRDAAG